MTSRGLNGPAADDDAVDEGEDEAVLGIATVRKARRNVVAGVPTADLPAGHDTVRSQPPKVQGPPRQIHASRKAVFVIAANLVGASLGYVALLLIGRYFQPEAYGSYVFAVSVTGLVALATNLGFGQAHQRQIALGVAPERALGVLVRIRAMLALALVLVAAVVYVLWQLVDGPQLSDATSFPVLVVALGLQAVTGSRQVLFDTWMGQQRVNRVETIRTIDIVLAVTLLSQAALLLAHLQGRWTPLPGLGRFWANAFDFIGPLSASESALLLIGSYFIAKATTLIVAAVWNLRDRVSIGPWDANLARTYRAFALPIALTGALGLVLAYTDVVMLGFFWTSREVGLYGASQKLAGLCLLAAGAMAAVLFPRFAQLRAEGRLDLERATFEKAERYLLLVVVPAAAAMIALPKPGLHIAIGDQYLNAAPPLRFLALWAVVAAMENPIAARFMGSGHARLLVYSSGFNAGANILLNLVFVPQGGLGLGPAGAALATLLSTALSYVFLRSQSRKHHGLAWVDRHQILLVLCGIIAGLFWWGAENLLGPTWFDRAWELLLWGAAGVLVYFAAAAAVGELKRADLHFLRRAVHPGSLLAELRGR